MPLIATEYSYADRKMTVTASCNQVKIEYLDAETGTSIYTSVHAINGTQMIWASVNRKWHSDYIIKVYIDGVVEHIERTSLLGKTVIVRLDSTALGDNLAWVTYAVDFQRRHSCKLLLSTFHNYLFRHLETPAIKLIGPNDHPRHDVEYKIGVFSNANLDPRCFRTKPLEQAAADILGLVYRERHLDLRYLAHARPIKEKYAVICTTATMAAKEWQNPDGWQSIVDYLNASGYKVVCIPKPRLPLVLHRLHTAEVGEDLIAGALTHIRYASIFIGLGSGLSWLARALDVPVVMISGFSEPFAEFKTGVARVINKDVCHGCYNDPSLEFGRNWGWCPRNHGGNNFICTRKIEPEAVKLAMGRVPSTRPSGRKKIMCVLPHCSTGGLPQYVLEKIKVLREAYDTYVLEWSFSGDAFNIQRDQIRELCTEFIELGMFRQRFQSVVDSIVPDVIHFEEFPSTYADAHILESFFKQYRRPVFHTSHGSALQKVWNADKYVFPAHYQLKLYPYVEGSVIEYPIFEEPPITDVRENSILNVGILSAHKNQGYLCEVARLMPETKFYFAGTQAQNFEAYWRPMVKSAPGNCIFLGQQNQDQIRALYRKCGLVAHPSLLELAPIVFTEALSHNCKIFTNWLDTYDSLGYKDYLNRLTMDPALDAEMLKQRLSLGAEQVRPAATYGLFRQKILGLYL